MSKTKTKVHYDTTKSGDTLKASLCGMMGIDVEQDISLVTCKMCQARFVAGNKRPAAKPPSFSATAADISQPFAQAYATLLDSPGMPPRMTPETWNSTCKGAVHGPCRHCSACERDAEIDRYAFAAPWKKQHGIQRAGGWAWPSVSAALRAWATWKQEGPSQSSAQGLMLEKVRDGVLGCNASSAKGEDINLERAGDLARVEQSLCLAYPDGKHATLTAAQCKTLLLDRTPGVRVVMVSFEDMAPLLGVGVGELKAIVRHGRTTMYEDLLQRGLVPRAQARRERPALSRMTSEVEY